MLQLIMSLVFIVTVSGAYGWALFLGPDPWRPRLGRKPLPVSHRPDYAKIRRLELELGLRDPDPPPVTEPVVPVSSVFWAPAVINAATGGGTWAKPNTDPNYSDSFREQMAAYARWQTCPVCLRRHEGRCAG